MVIKIHLDDKKDLAKRLHNFTFENEKRYSITRIEADYLSKLVTEDWHRTIKRLRDETSLL
jgi:hypothetical protein